MAFELDTALCVIHWLPPAISSLFRSWIKPSPKPPRKVAHGWLAARDARNVASVHSRSTSWMPHACAKASSGWKRPIRIVRPEYVIVPSSP